MIPLFSLDDCLKGKRNELDDSLGDNMLLPGSEQDLLRLFFLR
ncbi:hypothetical protein [Pinibacter aurantiacus]|nr:hypothetical protein [Pinibacter aurantiacus]